MAKHIFDVKIMHFPMSFEFVLIVQAKQGKKLVRTKHLNLISQRLGPPLQLIIVAYLAMQYV
jgi:hypothetical protein